MQTREYFFFTNDEECWIKQKQNNSTTEHYNSNFILLKLDPFRQIDFHLIMIIAIVCELNIQIRE